jgi:RimJ/RimL family protein N-acetyltransferase
VVLDGLTVTWPRAGDAAGSQFIRPNTDDEVPFVIERIEDGARLGGCTLKHIQPPQRSGIVSIWIAAPFQGSGYGTDALRTMCRFAVDHMNLQRLELTVLANNAGAIRSYEKVGFRVEGTKRRSEFIGGIYLDMLVMGLLAEELIRDERAPR